MSTQGKKGCAKAGRNVAWCTVYLKQDRRLRNKLLRALRTLRKQPNNTQLHALFAATPDVALRDACRVYSSRTGRHIDWTKVGDPTMNAGYHDSYS